MKCFDFCYSCSFLLSENMSIKVILSSIAIASSTATYCTSNVNTAWDVSMGACVCAQNQLFAVPAAATDVAYGLRTGSCVSRADVPGECADLQPSPSAATDSVSCASHVSVVAITGCTSGSMSYYGWGAICAEHHVIAASDCADAATRDSTISPSLNDVQNSMCSCPANYPFLYSSGSSFMCQSVVPQGCATNANWSATSSSSALVSGMYYSCTDASGKVYYYSASAINRDAVDGSAPFSR